MDNQLSTHSKLAPLHASNDAPKTSRWRRTRLVAAPVPPLQPRVPLSSSPPKPEPSVERSKSKMSLFNLFSKPNVEKARGHSEIGLAVPMAPPPEPKKVVAPAAPKPTIRLDTTSVVAQPTQSRMNNLIRTRSREVSTEGRKITWDPPPLFQAYPQALKYATVQSCVLQPEVLLRSQSQKRQYSLLRERLATPTPDSIAEEGSSDRSPETKKLEKGMASHKRLTSSSTLSSPELTDKIYVLVTTGYILQYAADGTFDRLPEKVLQLGKESAAFACDLIPGKHWVLQISQTAKDDGTVSIGPQRSFLSRLRLQHAGARRTATSFLLIMESAEEMDSWLTAVRREIDVLGGARVKDEAEARASADEASEKMDQKLTHRYLVQRDPHRFKELPRTNESPVESPIIVGEGWERNRSRTTLNASESASLSSKRASARMSMEAPSIATTTVSNDQVQLNQLRESPRYSYMSNGTGTATLDTSRDSSPCPISPQKDTFPVTENEPRSATSLRSFHMNPSTASSTRRRSMQTLPTTNEDSSLPFARLSPKPQRHSTFGPPMRATQQEVHIPASAYFNRRTSIRPSQSPEKSSPDMRSSSAPEPRPSPRDSVISPSPRISRESIISPPPRDPAPPPATRPQSGISNLPSASTLSVHSVNRSAQKPLFRPLPVRTQGADGTVVLPRRSSAFGPPLPLAVVVNRAVSTPNPQKPSATSDATEGQENRPTTHAPPSLRRPTSMQIKTGPAPFLLSASRPAPTVTRAVSNTPSFVQGTRGTPASRQSVQYVSTRRSMPVIRLPPPAPPPNMPLPPPPPSPPPNMPLPPPPAVST